MGASSLENCARVTPEGSIPSPSSRCARTCAPVQLSTYVHIDRAMEPMMSKRSVRCFWRHWWSAWGNPTEAPGLTRRYVYQRRTCSRCNLVDERSV